MFGHILVVDDDLRIRQLISQFLSENGYAVSTAGSIAECEILFTQFIFDVAVMDVMMPGETGIDFLKRRKINLPIILLSALGKVDDRISGLECGAEDYLTKPFDPRELLLRLYNIMKRGNQSANKESSFGEFKLELASGKLTHKDKNIHLTTAEKTILLELAKSAGKIISRDTLCQILGGIETRTVDAHIARLRSKMEANPKSPEFLQTIRGEGYVLWSK